MLLLLSLLLHMIFTPSWVCAKRVKILKMSPWQLGKCNGADLKSEASIEFMNISLLEEEARGRLCWNQDWIRELFYGASEWLVTKINIGAAFDCECRCMCTFASVCVRGCATEVWVWLGVDDIVGKIWSWFLCFHFPREVIWSVFRGWLFKK